MPFTDHPLRYSLSNEVHARPPVSLRAPKWVSFLAFMRAEGVQQAEVEHLRALYESLAMPVPEDLLHSRHLHIQTPRFDLKWETHSEFSSYTFFTDPQEAVTDARPNPLAVVPAAWLEAIPGALITATHLEILSAQTTDPRTLLATLCTPGELLIASQIAENTAWLFTDLKIREGFSHFTVIDAGLGKMRAGRTVQRLLEIEIYRLMALLAFPVAKQVGEFMDRAEAELAQLLARMSQEVNPGEIDSDKDHHLLADLTELAAQVENSIAHSSFRFAASQAYFQLVRQRINELKETPISGMPSISGFMQRRLTPALNTCTAMKNRQEDLSARIGRTSLLLRTRVEVTLERQNQQLLAEMNRRVKLQLRLQQTVEGLSVVVLTYYGSQLVQYLFKGTKAWHNISPDLATAIAIPVIALLTFWGSRRMHDKLRAEDKGAK